MSAAGLTVMVDGLAHPLCGCCLEAPACDDPEIRDCSYGQVCLTCFCAMADGIEALNNVGLVTCSAAGPDHDEGGAA